MQLALVHDAHFAVTFPEQDPEVNLDGRVARIGVGGPLHVAHASAFEIAASVVRARLEGLAHLIGHEQGDASGPAVDEGCLHCRPQVHGGSHVTDGVVDEDGIKRPAEPKRPYVAFYVLALGIACTVHSEHLGRNVHERHREMILQMEGIDSAPRSKVQHRARRRFG